MIRKTFKMSDARKDVTLHFKALIVLGLNETEGSIIFGSGKPFALTKVIF